MKLALVYLLTVLAHVGLTGGRVTTALYAIALDASPLTVGLLMSLFALLPMIFAVKAGRMIDRIGAARPMAWAAGAVVLGLLVPFAWPSLAALYLSSVVIGTAFMVYQVALNNVVGALGEPAARPVNFAWLALGFSSGALAGPLLAGFAIDGIGHRAAFLLLAAFPALALAVLLAQRTRLPRAGGEHPQPPGRHVGELLRNPRLRPAFFASALLATGWDLYTFVIPIHGSRIGLSATTIGIVMASFATATFTVRLLMPVLARRLREWTVITAALLISGAAYSMFPFSESVAPLMALSFLLGIGLGCAQPMINSLLYTASPPGRQGEVIGLRTTLLNASHTVMPLLFGAVGSALGMGPVFWTISACLLSGGWLARRRVK